MILSDVDALENARATTEQGRRTIVVGGGAVGLYLANELRQRDRDCEVVVIEAGGNHLGSFDEDSFASIGMKHSGIKFGRSRTLGGTTNLWGGQLVEFQPADFAGRSWMPGSKWPVDYSEIAPFYARTYENLGIPPSRQDDGAIWRSIAVTPPALGTEFEPFLTRWLMVPNFSILFAKELRDDSRLLVLTDHPVVGIVSAASGRITGVRMRAPDGEIRVLEADTFVLAAGTIENARLLLTAAAVPGNCPWRDNTNVGAYFQDHLGGRVAAIQPEDSRVFFESFSTIARGGAKYEPKIRLRNEVLERERTVNIQGMFNFESSASQHLVYLKQFLKAAVFSRRISGLGDFFRNARGSAKYLLPLMWRYVWDHRIFIPSSSKISLVLQVEQVPCADSRIRIDTNATDAIGLPRVLLDWRLAGADELESMRTFTIRVAEAFRAAGLGRVQIDEDLLALSPSFLSTLSDTIHQSGGAVMGWSELDGVVDRDLRVFGTDNLYVGGSSTFRTISNANTTFTALAFATRLADHLSSVRR